MAQVELIMPKMGESIMEATILNWLVEEGDSVREDESVLEIATDKVDSEVPAPVDGTISKILYRKDETVEIGEVIALIETEGEEAEVEDLPTREASEPDPEEPAEEEQPSIEEEPEEQEVPEPAAEPASGEAAVDERERGDIERAARPSQTERFYSPLVRNIAEKENISVDELNSIEGTGLNDRVTKRDVLHYLEERTKSPKREKRAVPSRDKAATTEKKEPAAQPLTATPGGAGDVPHDIVEMDRMRKLISDHMIRSKQTSAHVTSFVEADVTDLVEWRNEHKEEFQEQYGEKITYTPLFVEAVVKAIRDFPMINISVEGDQILKKKQINIGMATARPDGNLIVPVIRDADHLNLVGLTKKVNDLARRGRDNELKPQEIQGGTFTLTNVGTFGNVMGTPIINQPQVAILAAGAIRKKPAVVETEYGDVIAIRQLMYLSLSYDHRVVDGALGGSFLRQVADYLEDFDTNRTI